MTKKNYLFILVQVHKYSYISRIFYLYNYSNNKNCATMLFVEYLHERGVNDANQIASIY